MFLTFAAMTTVIAVFENIMAFTIDDWEWERKKLLRETELPSLFSLFRVFLVK